MPTAGYTYIRNVQRIYCKANTKQSTSHVNGYIDQWKRNEEYWRHVIDEQMYTELARTHGSWYSGKRPADECIFNEAHIFRHKHSVDRK